MLELYAQDIVRTLCETLGRSVLITDVDATIIAAPAEERIGTIHPPSIPVMKYGKMSFDDTEAARELGVWYPGATVPIFFQGRVVGSVAIAGEPEVVCKFALLVENQVESILREKVLLESSSSSQRYLDDLIRSLYCFDPMRDDVRGLTARAAKYGYRLDMPRVAVAVEFSNFRELNPEENSLGFSYHNTPDPFQDELDYQSLQSNVINVLRHTFADPQDLVSSVARDRFVILKAIHGAGGANAPRDPAARPLDEVLRQAVEVFENLQRSSMETVMAIGSIADTLLEIPFSYDNAWDTVLLAKKTQHAPGVYCFHDFALEHIFLSIRNQPRHAFVWDRVALIEKSSDGKELLETFIVYGESFFSKQKAAERLFIHRNTLMYRLNKLEKILNIDLSHFSQAFSLYLACKMHELKE